MSNLFSGTFIVPHRVVQIFESAGEILKRDHSKKALGRLFCGAIIVPYSFVIIFESLDEMKGTGQYFPLVLFIML